MRWLRNLIYSCVSFNANCYIICTQSCFYTGRILAAFLPIYIDLFKDAVICRCPEVNWLVMSTIFVLLSIKILFDKHLFSFILFSARFRSRTQEFLAIFTFQMCWTGEHSIEKALQVWKCSTLNMTSIMYPTFNITLGSEAVSVPVPPILAAYATPR